MNEISDYDLRVAARALNLMEFVIDQLTEYGKGGVSAEVTLHAIEQEITKGLGRG